jgi:hypothetical protein
LIGPLKYLPAGTLTRHVDDSAASSGRSIERGLQRTRVVARAVAVRAVGFYLEVGCSDLWQRHHGCIAWSAGVAFGAKAGIWADPRVGVIGPLGRMPHIAPAALRGSHVGWCQACVLDGPRSRRLGVTNIPWQRARLGARGRGTGLDARRRRAPHEARDRPGPPEPQLHDPVIGTSQNSAPPQTAVLTAPALGSNQLGDASAARVNREIAAAIALATAGQS